MGLASSQNKKLTSLIGWVLGRTHTTQYTPRHTHTMPVSGRPESDFQSFNNIQDFAEKHFIDDYDFCKDQIASGDKEYRIDICNYHRWLRTNNHNLFVDKFEEELELSEGIEVYLRNAIIRTVDWGALITTLINHIDTKYNIKLKEEKEEGTESEWYCDVQDHEDIKLLNDGEGGWTCPVCDSEEEEEEEEEEEQEEE